MTLMTTSEAAAYLRMTPKTLMNKKAAGLIPGNCVRKLAGTRVLYVKEGLEKWVAQAAAS